MRKMRLTRWMTLVVAVITCFASAAGAAEFARVQLSPTHGLDIDQLAPGYSFRLTLSTPDGETHSWDFVSESPDLQEYFSQPGQYVWNLVASPNTRRPRTDLERAGLERRQEALMMSGYARVDQDGLVAVEEKEEPTVALRSPSQSGLTPMVAADQVILDDLIVDGSICAGLDCVNGESFGFDTLRLKENNLRIRAQDTSTSASFPSTDWQITFNESSNGGANKFSIDDLDSSTTPFTVEGGAPSHSLYVDDGGKLGLGTNTPVVDVHVKSGNTPTLRLEQDGSSGFTPQTWDVAGNETNFFVRDATNGSTLPFRIEPGAPTNAVFIEDTGDVGVGTNLPSSELHVLDSDDATAQVQSTSANAIVLVNAAGNNSTVRFQANNSRDWVAGLSNTADEFNINNIATVGVAEFAIDNLGNVTIPVGAMYNGSDRNLKTNIVPQDSREILSLLVDLPISAWSFKTSMDHRHIGPMSQDFYATFGLGRDDKSISPLDASSIAMAAIQGLNQVVEEKEAALEALRQENADLAARLQALEAIVLSNQ